MQEGGADGKRHGGWGGARVWTRGRSRVVPCDALSGETLTKVVAQQSHGWDTAPGPRQLQPNLSRHAARGSSPSHTL